MDCLNGTDYYLQQLQASLPRGAAWSRDPDGTWTRVLDASAQELTRIDCRGAALFNEALPDTTQELLEDWERVLGLPDECLPRDDSIESRREAVLAKLRAQGGQNAAYYLELAAWLGFAGGRIQEFLPFTCNSVCTDSLYTDPWRYVWIVEVPQLPPGNEDRDRALECLLNRYKPAHTHVIVRYATHYYVLPGYWEPGYAEGEQP